MPAQAAEDQTFMEDVVKGLPTMVPKSHPVSSERFVYFQMF